MTTKETYSQMALIFNTNLMKIRRQLNSQELKNLKDQYKPTSDSHLAKILMLKGISL